MRGDLVRVIHKEDRQVGSFAHAVETGVAAVAIDDVADAVGNAGGGSRLRGFEMEGHYAKSSLSAASLGRIIIITRTFNAKLDRKIKHLLRHAIREARQRSKLLVGLIWRIP